MSELDYTRGNRMAWLQVLNEAMRQLGYRSGEVQVAKWAAERERAVFALREVCEHYGDNDWPEDLDLSDIIEKHLGRYLE